MSTYSDDDYDHDYDDYTTQPRRTFGFSRIPMLSSRHKMFVGMLLLLALAAVAYGTHTYGTLARAAEVVHNKTVSKLTESPVPLDWREVDVKDLSAADTEKVRTYALAQAIFDTTTAAAVLISGLYLLSVLNQYEGLNLNSHAGAAASSFLSQNMGIVFLAVIVLMSSIYAMYHVFTLGGKHDLPFYMQWWYGNEYEWFSPWNMLGVLFVSGALVGLWYNQGGATSPLAGVLATTKDKDSGETKFKTYALLLALAYTLYAFYGSYLVHMVKSNEHVEPYLDFLYPLLTSLVIARLASMMSGENRVGVITFALCCALILFRYFGRRASKHWILNDFEFWTGWMTKIFVLALVVSTFMIVTGKQAMFTAAANTGSNYLVASGQRVQQRITAAQQRPQVILLAALLGGFFFFSLQLFWTTTIHLADFGLAVASALVLVLFTEDVSNYIAQVQQGVYAGFLVTGVIWMAVLQQHGFKALIENI